MFGALRFPTGEFRYHFEARKNNVGFRLLKKPVRRARRTGKLILLLADNAPIHHTQAVEEYLEHIKLYLKVFWLPDYCPDLCDPDSGAM